MCILVINQGKKQKTGRCKHTSSLSSHTTILGYWNANSEITWKAIPHLSLQSYITKSKFKSNVLASGKWYKNQGLIIHIWSPNKVSWDALKLYSRKMLKHRKWFQVKASTISTCVPKFCPASLTLVASTECFTTFSNSSNSPCAFLLRDPAATQDNMQNIKS